MAGRLTGKVAVITGGASGMGRAMALRFLDEGAAVVIADLNEAMGAETVELATEATGRGDICFIRADVTEEPDVQAMIELAVTRFGRLDCVCNNAGIGGAVGPITDVEVAEWDQTFAVLVRGVFLGIKHGARVLKRQGGPGSIINTASIAGLSGAAGPQAYSAAKAAVINLTAAAAVELAPHHIRVNAICPGAILTPLLHGGDPDAVAPVLQRFQPLPMAGLPEHVAGAALYLASDDAAFVTGESLIVDGGLTAAGPDLNARMGATPSQSE